MTGRPRLGLRAQIVFALFAVFALSFALLGMATLRLTRAAASAERTREARLTAQLLSAWLEGEADPAAQLPTSLERLSPRLPVTAAVLQDARGRRTSFGRAPEGPGVTVPFGQEGQLTLWLKRPPLRFHLPLANLLVFYVGLTGLAVMLLAYFALTWLVVRPLDELTRQSELLAAGSPLRAPARGAAEVVRLGAALNAMAEQLRAERNALEQRLAELEATAQELRTTQQQLIHGEKLASVGRLAAGVAHEIGNPLSAILGLLELLREGDLPPPQAQEFLVRIQRETERINRIIRDLLDFSRRHPEDEVAGQTADLRQAIEDAVNLVRPQKESKQVTLEVDIDTSLRRVAAPQHRLTQVVLNLVLNAIDALEGRGCVAIEARPLDGGMCLLSVTDDGPGIPVHMLDRLFEPFTTSKPAGKGTGLGLAVSHALIEAMGGRISVQNREQGGARFELRLRAANSEPDSEPPALTAREQS